MSRAHAKWRSRSTCNHRTRLEVLHRADYRCEGCGSRGRRLEIDHIVPLADGGTSEQANLQALCRACHMEKTALETGNFIPGAREWSHFVKGGRRA